MNEELLQYIWMSGLFNANNLKTADGQDITIYLRGKLNTDSGPDFSHARVRIGDTEWVGNIEIHLRSDEWNQHKHHEDKAYNTVILHVVYEDNAECRREDGSLIACIELKDRIPENLFERYRLLKTSEKWIPCEDFISLMDGFTVEQALHRALVQRLERKCLQVNTWLDKADNDWNAVFYHALARSFGFGTNSEAFEQVAMNLPLNILSKHRNNNLQSEALVFGVAGFLLEQDGDQYYSELRNEWHFLKLKYGLKELEKSSFKFMRMRPGNFPGIRLAQFAALAIQCTGLFSKIKEDITASSIKNHLKFPVQPYWEEHYYFSKTSSLHNAELTATAIHQIMINAIVPILFVYGKHIGNEDICNRTFDLLQALPAENNHIIRDWKSHNIQAKNAFDSQALLELKKNYCDEKKCLNCLVGNKVMNM